MEAKQIEIVRKWPEPKSVQDIQVFLGFANFYWRFIQGFSRIGALLISMLKTTNEPAPNKNNSSRSAFSRNDDNRLASEMNKGNGEVDRIGGGMKHAKKSGKLKGQKMSKSRKSAKSRKSSSKSGNSPNFDATESGPSFLTLEARSTFNCL